jgi:hypothetical protein
MHPGACLDLGTRKPKGSEPSGPLDRARHRCDAVAEHRRCVAAHRPYVSLACGGQPCASRFPAAIEMARPQRKRRQPTQTARKTARIHPQVTPYVHLGTKSRRAPKPDPRALKGSGRSLQVLRTSDAVSDCKDDAGPSGVVCVAVVTEDATALRRADLERVAVGRAGHGAAMRTGREGFRDGRGAEAGLR